MKKEEVPQDKSSLINFSKEVCYAVDETGKYTTDLSTGWDVKTSALNVAWNDIENRVTDAKAKVLNHEVSPILYYMELRIMDFEILAAYTGFWKWTIKRHLKPENFKSLSESRLKIYAEAFEISIAQLKNIALYEA
jgi:hypothetical protein